jgi:hypothetical protein
MKQPLYAIPYPSLLTHTQTNLELSRLHLAYVFFFAYVSHFNSLSVHSHLLPRLVLTRFLLCDPLSLCHAQPSTLSH